MDSIVTVFVFAFGLVIGSFLNAVIPRLASGESIVRGTSRCPHCKYRLSAPDLIPLLSFIALRGRCRHCRRPIGWRYPLIELATALSFLFLFLRFGPTPTFVVGLVATAFLIVIFVYDLQHELILDVVTIPAIAFAALAALLLHLSLTSVLLGAAIGGGVFALQYAVSRGRWIGGGDIRLGFFLGVLLGWERTLLTLVLAYIAGAIVALGLIAAGRRAWGSHVPFGTFLSAAGFVSFLIGDELIRWYLGKFV